mgnify:CR=1 FL=1
MILYKRLFSNKIITNSCHNQAVNKLGENLIIGGQSNDGVIEIIYHEFLSEWGEFTRSGIFLAVCEEYFLKKLL